MDWLADLKQLPGWEGPIVSVGVVVLAVILGLVAAGVIFHFLLRFAGRSDTGLDNVLVRRWRGPARLLLPLLLIILVSPSLHFHGNILDVFRHALSLTLIGAVAWLLANTVFSLREMVLSRYDVEARDNLKARAVYTQINVLVKIALVAIGVIAVASMLMTFEKIRQIGVSILASAGIIGVVVGFAAQRSIATLFAGVQIAVTQPIRLDDVVIVEGEWGKIEEISLTYVVVRIWDLRRLVLPITFFLEKPFQNWTRVSADLLGTVYLHADYTVPVEELRGALHHILEESGLWDGQVWGLQVTGATERAMELRALMSAPDSSTAWNLRCHVREKLIDFLQRNYPDGLPRVRAEIRGREGEEGGQRTEDRGQREKGKGRRSDE